MLLFNEAYRYAGCANGIGYYSTGQKFYRARVWYNASTSITPTYDMYPCIDADGHVGLYDRISGNIRYGRTRLRSSGWATTGTTNYGLLTAPEDIADSTEARVTDGNVEFATTAKADDDAQVSVDGVNWSTSVTVWSKAGDAEGTAWIKGAKNFGTSYTHTQASAETSDYTRLVWLWAENKGLTFLVY